MITAEEKRLHELQVKSYLTPGETIELKHLIDLKYTKKRKDDGTLPLPFDKMGAASIAEIVEKMKTADERFAEPQRQVRDDEKGA